MPQAHILVLNSFYLRFPSLVLHCYGPIPSLSVKFLPSKVLFSSCSNSVSYRVALNQQSVNCNWYANSCQHYITQWLCELQLKQSSHLLLQWGPANPACIQFSSNLCCLHTSKQIEKNYHATKSDTLIWLVLKITTLFFWQYLPRHVNCSCSYFH